MSDPFMGEIRMVGFNFAPRGWATCQGQIMAIQQNSALFALLGVGVALWLRPQQDRAAPTPVCAGEG